MRKFIPFIFSVVFVLSLANSYGQGGMIVPPGTKVTIGQNTTLDIGGDKLLLMDATVINLCHEMFDWARYRPGCSYTVLDSI